MDKQLDNQNVSYRSLLDMLTETEMEMLETHATVLTLSKNEILYKIGQDATSVFIIKQGRIKITTMGAENKEVLKSLIHEGEIFGEGAIFGVALRPDSASAMDPGVIVYKVPASTARQLMQSNPAFSFKVTAQIAQKLRQAEKRLESLTFQNSRTRIIEFLKDTARKQGKQVGYETLLRPFLTHQDIGNLTTTSRQTVSSVLNELKGSNKIYYDRHRLLIRDMSCL